MSDGGRDGASLGVAVWKSSQQRDVQPPVVRSIAWLGLVHTNQDQFVVLRLNGYARPLSLYNDVAFRNKS
jgi:hypothetical protein